MSHYVRKEVRTLSKKLAVTSFILSNFSYCPLVWHFSNSKSKIKIEQIQKRALKFLDHNPVEPIGPVFSSMEIKRLRTLAIEIYKTINCLNPVYMKDLFGFSKNRTSDRLKYNIESHKFNQVKYGKKSLRVLGPILWNSLPNDAKALPTLDAFKRFIKKWGIDGCPLYKKFTTYIEATK